MNVLMTSCTDRCLQHWWPVAERIRNDGGRCDLLLFPHLSDPGHAGLMSIKDHVLLRLPVNRRFAFIGRGGETVFRQLRDGVVARYDAILMTSGVVGPELRIKAMLASPRTKVVSLQHGVYQPWSRYEKQFPASFDYFGMFGPAFVSRFRKHRSRALPLSFPRLDGLKQIADLSGPIVIALQSRVTPRVIAALARGLARFGYDVLLKPHPEHTRSHDKLRADFPFASHAEPFHELLVRVRPSAVVTTGSTAALEALECGIPTAVLPAQNGDIYAEFGIVASDISADAVLSVVQRFDKSAFKDALANAMERHTGPRGQRVQTVVDHICALSASTLPTRRSWIKVAAKVCQAGCSAMRRGFTSTTRKS